MIDRGKARLVAKGYSQVEGVDYLDTLAPTASTASTRLVAATACKLDRDLRHLDVDQALFIQSWIPIFLEIAPWVWAVIGYGSPTQQSSLWAEAEWSLVV